MKLLNMNPNGPRNEMTRREWLQGSSALIGGTVFSSLLPGALAGRRPANSFPGSPQQPTSIEAATAMRARMGQAPIQALKLSENLTLLSGPGGNVVVLDGRDGKLMVDTFVLPAWASLKEHLDAIGSAPLKTVINTHWHFDHTDNNAHVREAGATIMAHENTKKRMSEPHDLIPLGLHFDASATNALPQKTFKTREKLDVNGERVAIAHVPPAHTDTDIYLHFEKANVIQTGDVFYNGTYGFIDGATGGSLHGVIGAATKIIELADAETKIVPGHGPLGNKESFTKYRDMLTIVHERVQKQKEAGKSVDEVVASKPTADLDQIWGRGDNFVRIAYTNL
jgi:cyclase